MSNFDSDERDEITDNMNGNHNFFSFEKRSSFMKSGELKRVIEIIKELPKDISISWGHDHYRLNPEGIRASYLDIYIPLICDQLSLNWLLTLEISDKLEGLVGRIDEITSLKALIESWVMSSIITYDNIYLNPDKLLYLFTDIDSGWYCERGSKLRDLGIDLDSEEIADFVNPTNNAQNNLVVLPGIGYEAINESLKSYIYFLSGREDISFYFDDSLETPMLSHLKERSQEESYQIGEGIYAASGVIDFLATLDKEESVVVMSEIKKLKDTHQFDGRGN